MPAENRMTITETAPGNFDVAGEIDAHTAPAFAEYVDNSAADHVAVDMSEVSFMDSSGLRVLVELQQRSATGGRTLTICRPSRAIVRLLELTGLTDEFDVHPG
jgi:anti-sigma B factor antagonist